LRIEAKLKEDNAAVRRGGPFDRWDFDVRGGSLGAARLRIALEEHGFGRQLMRVRVWPRAPIACAMAAVLAGLATGAALDGLVVTHILFGVAAVLIAELAISHCRGAMRLVLLALGYQAEAPEKVALGGLEPVPASPLDELAAQNGASPRRGSLRRRGVPSAHASPLRSLRRRTWSMGAASDASARDGGWLAMRRLLLFWRWPFWRGSPRFGARPPEQAQRKPGSGVLRLGTGNRDWITEEVSENPWALWRSLPRVRPYLHPYRRLMVISTLTSVAAAALLLAEPWPLAIILDNVLRSHDLGGILGAIFGNPSTYVLLAIVIGLRLAIVVLGNGTTLLSDYLNAKVEQNMVLDFRSQIFEHVQRLSMGFHDKKLTGQLMARINYQASALGTIVMAFPPVLQATLTVIGMVVITAIIDWQLALISLVILPLLYASFGLYGKKIVPRIREVNRLEWQSLSIVHEAMSMLRVIRSFGRERYEHEKFVEQGKRAVDRRVKLTVSQNLYTLGVQTITALGTSAVLGLGVYHVLTGVISTGELIVLISYVASVYTPLEQISATVADLHQQLVIFSSSLRLLEEEPEVTDAPDAVEIDRARGEIDVEEVQFSYGRRRGHLHGLSLHADPGERIAVVGPTGAGKTTLMSLLIRFYDPQEGRISIDGLDIRKIKLASLREQISVVLQEPMLFSGPVGDNILYGRLNATEDEVIAAAKAANAHDFIERLPKGYETIIGEGGADLSGGERQRIAVARAFLKDAPILILDEPTSSIDSRTERVILDALDDLIRGRTSFLVAHRLSTVRHADRIVVMNRGRVVQQGTHDELLATGGLYRQLHHAQRRERTRRQEALQDARRAGEPVPSLDNGGAPDSPIPAARPGVQDGALANGGEVTWRQVDAKPLRAGNRGGRGRPAAQGGRRAKP
jgi:ATP-binding cassette, subfamily B, bacterial